MKKMALNKMNLVIIIFLELAGIFLWKNYGYNMIMFLSGLSTIPEDPYRVSGSFGDY